MWPETSPQTHQRGVARSSRRDANSTDGPHRGTWASAASGLAGTGWPVGLASRDCAQADGDRGQLGRPIVPGIDTDVEAARGASKARMRVTEEMDCALGLSRPDPHGVMAQDDALPEDDDNAWVWTCTIITRPATDTLGHIHDRCPVLVPTNLREAWLDCTAADASIAKRLLSSIPEPHLEPRRVSTAVNKVQNNGPELVEPVAEDPEPEVLPLPLDDA